MKFTSFRFFLHPSLRVFDIFLYSRGDITLYPLKGLSGDFALGKKLMQKEEIENVVFFLRFQLISFYVPLFILFVVSLAQPFFDD